MTRIVNRYDENDARPPRPIPLATRRAVYRRVRRRNGRGSCEGCGRRRAVDLHHLRRWVGGLAAPPLVGRPARIDGRETPADLAALCRDCHFASHRDTDGTYWWDVEAMEREWD